MTRVLGAVVVWMFVVCGAVGSALAYGGSDYLQACNLYLLGREGVLYAQAPMTLKIGMCMGYTEGVFGTALQLDKRSICAPEEVESERLVRIAMKYLENHPEQLHYGASSTILIAFREAFPCPVSR